MAERPLLKLDLSGSDGNVFVVIGLTRGKLAGQLLEHFDADIAAATTPGAEKKYADILAIVNRYVRLIDTSGMYAEYAVNQEEVVAAITRFNEQLKTLPDNVPCSLEDLYPDFDHPDTDANAYMALLRLEIKDTEQDIELVGYDEASPLRRLLAMLQECVSALRSAGIE